jgi:hypothetical protein
MDVNTAINQLQLEYILALANFVMLYHYLEPGLYPIPVKE